MLKRTLFISNPYQFSVKQTFSKVQNFGKVGGSTLEKLKENKRA
jgi:hypothetical protein